MKKQCIKAVCFFLCLSIAFPIFASVALASEGGEETIRPATEETDAFVAIAEAFGGAVGEGYCVAVTDISEDSILGIPVRLTTYNDPLSAPKTYHGATGDIPVDATQMPNLTVMNGSQIIGDGKPTVLYMINTNTERIGTDTDVSIISDLLSDGYHVVVVDYFNHEKAISPALDSSVQTYREEINTNFARKSAYLGGLMAWQYYTYVLPAGYRISRDVKYFNYAENATDGSLDYIVRSWNNSFTTSWASKTRSLYSSDGTRIYRGLPSTLTYNEEGELVYDAENTKVIKDIVATTVEDCIRLDGTPIDLNLYMTIIYPSNPEQEVPVMNQAASSWKNASSFHSTGFLTRGYAVAIWEHAFMPMARNEHYGYFEGPNDRNAFTMMQYTGVKVQTAAARFVRYLADLYPDKYKFDTDHMGVIGISKSAHVYMLGSENPEATPEQKFFSDSEGNLLYGACQNPQPWTEYPSTGEPIPSGVQMLYTSVGSGYETVGEHYAPLFTSGGLADGGTYGFFTEVMKSSYYYDVPAFGVNIPDFGHALLPNQYNSLYGYNTYETLFRFADYWLKGSATSLEYITPLPSSEGVETDGAITLYFTGEVEREELEKHFTLKNLATGETVTGVFRSSFGGIRWEFVPDERLDGGMPYQVTVAANLKGKNGIEMGEEKTTLFFTEYEGYVYSSGEDKTVSSAYGAYYVFSPLDLKNSTTTSLCVQIANESANTLGIYALANVDIETPENSHIGERLGTAYVTGVGRCEVDITEYIKNLDTTQPFGFYLIADKAAAETVVYTQSWESVVDPADENNKVYKTSNLSSKFYGVLGTTTLAPTDLGRKFRITFDVFGEGRKLFAYMQNLSSQEKKYVEIIDLSHQVIPTKNAWQTVTVEYQISDEYYIERNKSSLVLTRKGMTGEGYYIDNIVTTEIVTDVRVASVSLITHPAEQHLIGVTDKTYVGGGALSETVFSDTDTLLVGGPSDGISGAGYKTYLKVPLDGIDLSSPYALYIKAYSGKGTIRLFGLSDVSLSDAWDPETVNYLNAPANDRLSATPLLTKVYNNAPIGEIVVGGEGTYFANVTDYIAYMKRAGAQYATLILCPVADESTTITFEVCSALTSLFTVLSHINYDDAESASIALKRANNVYDETDVYMQGTTSGVTAELAEDIVYGTGGKSLKVVVGTGSNNVLKLLRLVQPSAEHYFTADDLGTSYTVKVKVYATREDTCTLCMSTVASNATYDATASAKVYLGQKITLLADQWNELSYTFTVTEPMLGERPSDITTDARPVQFSIFGVTSNTLYFDEMTLSKEEELPTESDFAYYVKDFEDGAYTGISYNGIENVDLTSEDSRLLIVDDENASPKQGSTRALRLYSNQKYNRLYFTDATPFGEEDIGDVYTVKFCVKVDRTGSFTAKMGNKSIKTKTFVGQPSKTFTFTSDDIGRFVECTFTFTVTSDLLVPTDDSGTALGLGVANQLTLFINGFSQTADDPVTFVLDEIVSYKNYDSACDAVETNAAVAGKTQPEELTVGALPMDEGVYKSYLYFDNCDIRRMQKAILELPILSGGGQVCVYGVTDFGSISGIHFANAPANAEGTSVNPDAVYGGAPLASAYVTGGTLSVDVSDYIATRQTGDALFLLVSDDAVQSELLSLSFPSFVLYEDVDYTAEGSVVYTEEGLSVDGKVTFTSAIPDNYEVGEGISLLVRISLVAEDGTVVSVSLGNGASDVISKSETVKDGVLEVSFLVSGDVAETGLSTLSLSTNDAITLTSVSLSVDRVIRVGADATLCLDIAKVPESAPTNFGVTQQLTLSSDFGTKIYIPKKDNIRTILFDGVTYDLAALANVPVVSLSGEMHYLFEAHTNALQAASDIPLVIKYIKEDTLTAYETYSVGALAYGLDYLANESDPEGVALVKAALRVIVNSCQYFGEDIENAETVMEALGDAQAPDLSMYTPQRTVDALDGATFALSYKLAVAFVPSLDEGGEPLYAPEEYTFFVEGEEVKAELREHNGRTILYLPLGVSVIDKTINYEVGGVSGAYNLYDYYVSVAKSDSALSTLVESIFSYAASARAYIATHG